MGIEFLDLLVRERALAFGVSHGLGDDRLGVLAGAGDDVVCIVPGVAEKSACVLFCVATGLFGALKSLGESRLGVVGTSAGLGHHGVRFRLRGRVTLGQFLLSGLATLSNLDLQILARASGLFLRSLGP